MMLKTYLKKLIYLFVVIGVSSSYAGAYEDFFKGLELDHPTTVTSVLDKGFDPNSPSEKGEHGLMVALRNESYKAFVALLASPSVRIDTVNAAGETPLMLAALRGQADLCRRLIERGAQVNREGWTPLHYAASGPDAKSVKLLLERGAQIDALSPNGSTAVMMAARYGPEDSVFALLDAGADPKLRNQRNMNVVDFARSAGRDSLAARLEKRMQ